ncbi:MAG: hypothetical protein IH984_05785 [Planctomycetes bacterium]|nr:hypothetical protein [Planctomycetota bacterium]
MDDTKYYESVDDMPPNWWRDESRCKTLRDSFEKHIVGLHVAFKQNGIIKNEIFTGCILLHNDYCFWITAAHVIETIKKLAKDQSIEIVRSVWLDHAPESLGGPLPVDIGDLSTVCIDPKGFDFGFVLLSPGYAVPLLSTRTLEPLDSTIWLNHESATPEGFLLVGYPGEWIENEPNKNDNASGTMTIKFGIACLPAERIEDRGEQTNNFLSSFWGREDCFYGQLVPYSNGRSDVVNNIGGMSGGPLLSVERHNNQIRYRLYGIQSCWFKDTRIIRAAHIEPISFVLDEFTKALKSA